jgi:hypothetical protein
MWADRLIGTLIVVIVALMVGVVVLAFITGGSPCPKGEHYGTTGWVWTGKQMSPVYGCVRD